MAVGQNLTMTRPLAALLVCALFLAAMATFFLTYDAYTDGGPEVVPPLEFSTSTVPQPWQLAPRFAEIRNGELQLDSGSGKRDGGTLHAEVEAPKRFEAMRVRARMQTAQLVVGEYGWDTTRLILFFTDSQGKAHWEHPHSVCNFSGTHAWTRCEAVIVVPDFAVRAHIFAGNASARGRAWLDDLSVTACQRKAEAWRWTAFFAIGWSACLLLGFVTLRLWRGFEGTGVALLAAAIVLGVMVPEEVFTSTGERVIDTWKAWRSPAVPAPAAADVTHTESPASKAPSEAKKEPPAISPTEAIRGFKKFGHAVLFSILGGVSLWARRRRGIEEAGVPFTIAALFVFAAATEIAQFLTTTRSPLLSDFVIDIGGAAIGYVVMWALLPLRARAMRP